MEIPTKFLVRLLRNCAAYTDTVVERDAVEIQRRFENEGMSFLTIALPSLCDALDKGLAKGRIKPSDFEGFKPRGRKGSLPRLLSGFFMRVFELDGSLKDRPCIDSIRAIRQVTRLFKKVELPCSPARVKRAFERYVSNDEKCSEAQHADPYRIERVAGHLWSCLEAVSDRIYLSYGFFGNGATAEKLGRNARLSISQWPERGDHLFPSSRHCVASEDDSTTLGTIEFLKEDQERPVRVVTVPKTLKTPRIIAVEPSYMMLRQQSVARFLMGYLEREYRFRGSIRFTDQTVNRDRARLGSIDGSLATIDLSDASDLVSNDLVKRIFRVCPTFLEMIQAARTSTAQVPGYGVKRLNKFASQGSALCFPIEAMVFYTIVVASILHYYGESPSTSRIADITAKVSVYGDDIIVPSETAETVMDALETYGLRVNQEKSFHQGLFRESCGGDYYAGSDVTPTYVRQWSSSLATNSPKHVVAAISLSNQLYLKGYWNAAQRIRDHVERKFGRLARTTAEVGVLTWVSCCYNTNLKWDVHHHGYLARGLKLQLKHERDPILDTRGALFFSFMREHVGEERSADGLLGRRVSKDSWLPMDPYGLSQRASVCDAGDYLHHVTDCRPDTTQERRNSQSWVLRSVPTTYQDISSKGNKDPELVVDPYASSIKRRWASAYHTGLSW